MKYVLSDIHGNKDAWESIKKQINLTQEDDLYILGDVIDRNPYGIDILLEIMETENMHMLLGNHEHMMMTVIGYNYRDDDPYNDLPLKDKIKQWYQNGGDITHEAFKKLSKEKQNEIGEYLQSLPLTFSEEVGDSTWILCHANWEGTYSLLEEQMPEKHPELKVDFAIWDRDYIDVSMSILDHCEEKIEMVIGHTPVCHFNPDINEWENDKKFMSVIKAGPMYMIDCGAAYASQKTKPRGRLACLRLDDQKVFYSEEP